MARTVLKVTGMSCAHCHLTVTRALERVQGVHTAAVDLKAGRAVVDYDEARTEPRILADAVMDEGYEAEELG